MSTPFDIYTYHPKHWNDNLEWTLDTKPTLRHFQAILLACCERKWLTRINSLPSSVVEQMLHYQPKTFDNLVSIIKDCLNFVPESNKLINDKKFYASAGKEYLCFNREDMYWHYPKYEDILLDKSSEGIASGQFIEVSNRAFEKFYIENYPKSSRVAYSQQKLFDKFMFINNKDVMRFLISVKKIINGAHCIIFKPSIFYGADSFTNCTETFLEWGDGKKDDYETREFQTRTYFGHPNFQGVGICYQGEYRCQNVELVEDDKHKHWYYAFSPSTPPYKVINHSSTAFNLKAHWWELAENYELTDTENGFTFTGYLNEFHPIGNFRERGWHDFGIILPDHSKQIFEPKDSYQEPTTKPYWFGFVKTARVVEFSMGMDALLLDFGVDGGFNFFEKSE